MSISFALLYDNSLFSGSIEFGKEFKIGSHKKDNIIVKSMVNSQVVIKWKNSGLKLETKGSFSVNLKDAPLDTMIKLSTNEPAIIYLTESSGRSSKSVKIPYNCILNIGRKKNNNIILNLPFVSGEHFVIKSEAGNIRIEDKKSTNGIYVNGKRVNITKLRSGDVISIITVKIKLINGELFFEDEKNRLTINSIPVDSALDNTGSRNNNFSYVKVKHIIFKHFASPVFIITQNSYFSTLFKHIYLCYDKR